MADTSLGEVGDLDRVGDLLGASLRLRLGHHLGHHQDVVAGVAFDVDAAVWLGVHGQRAGRGDLELADVAHCFTVAIARIFIPTPVVAAGLLRRRGGMGYCGKRQQAKHGKCTFHHDQLLLGML